MKIGLVWRSFATSLTLVQASVMDFACALPVYSRATGGLQGCGAPQRKLVETQVWVDLIRVVAVKKA